MIREKSTPSEAELNAMRETYEDCTRDELLTMLWALNEEILAMKATARALREAHELRMGGQ